MDGHANYGSRIEHGNDCNQGQESHFQICCLEYFFYTGLPSSCVCCFFSRPNQFDISPAIGVMFLCLPIWLMFDINQYESTISTHRCWLNQLNPCFQWLNQRSESIGVTRIVSEKLTTLLASKNIYITPNTSIFYIVCYRCVYIYVLYSY